jgi:hypothetical protein
MSSSPFSLKSQSASSTQAKAQPQFKGMTQALGAAVMLSPVVSAFSALDQKNSMISIAARDGFDSSGRIYQEFQRNKYGGCESLISEGSAMLVWGFGITLCKQLYDKLVPKLSNGKILFPGLEDLSLLPTEHKADHQKEKGAGFLIQQSAPVQAWNRLAEKPGFEHFLGKIGQEPDPVENRSDAHVLDTETVQRYYKNTDDLPLENDEGLLEKPPLFADTDKTGFEARKEHLLALVADNGKNKLHLEHYMRNNIAKLVLCAGLPSLALGFLIPQLLHWITPKLVKHDREKAGFGNSGVTGKARHSIHKQKEKAAAPQFSGAASMLNPAVSWLLAHETIATMLFVDFPLSGSRIGTARNRDERDEIIFREVMIIAVLFWAQRAIQERIAKVFDKKLDGHTGIDIKALHRLYTGAVGKSPEQFQQAMQALDESFNIVQASSHSLEGEKKLVATVRQYFSDERQGERNLLFDLAEISRKIHTIGQGDKKAVSANGVHYIDLTKKIDTDGIREIAQYLQHLQGQVAQGKEIAPLLAHNALMKMGSFGFSALACWGIVSYLVPKGQHAITARKRGQSEFPGLDGIA